MSLADDLLALEQLHQRGSLSDAEFANAKTRLLGAAAAPTGCAGTTPVHDVNGMRRALDDRWIGGVCGGLARSTGMESWLWRLLFALTLLAGGIGLFAYILLWIFMPLESAPAAPSLPPRS